MRPTGYRSFHFPASDTGRQHGTRVKVFAEDAPLWWRMWLRCRPEDVRWAVSNTGDAHSGRFVALALEHAAARKQGRAPDPEVGPVQAGPWGPRLRWLGRVAFLGLCLAITGVSVVAVIGSVLALFGVVQVEVRYR